LSVLSLECVRLTQNLLAIAQRSFLQIT